MLLFDLGVNLWLSLGHFFPFFVMFNGGFVINWFSLFNHFSSCWLGVYMLSGFDFGGGFLLTLSWVLFMVSFFGLHDWIDSSSRIAFDIFFFFLNLFSFWRLI